MKWTVYLNIYEGTKIESDLGREIYFSPCGKLL